MIVKSVHYERLANLGNYNNHKLGIDIEIEPGESVTEVTERARQIVDQGLRDINKARREEDIAIAMQQSASRIRIAGDIIYEDEEENPF